MRKSFMIYAGTQNLLIPANTFITDSFNVKDIADFHCYYISVFTTTPYILFNIEIAHRTFFDRPIFINMVGGVQIPSVPTFGIQSIYFPVKIFMPRKNTVLLQLQNTTANPQNVSIVFQGYEVESGKISAVTTKGVK